MIATCSNQKEHEKLNFSGFVVKVAESQFAWFYSLLQILWTLEEVHWFIPIGPWALQRWYFYFCCATVFLYGHFNGKKIIDITNQ